MPKIDDTDPDVHFRPGRHYLKIMIPQALVIAAVTAGSTALVTRLNAPDPPPAPSVQHLDESTLAQIRAELGAIKLTQVQILEKLNQVETDAKNRDAVQDASIATIRNR